MQAGSPWGALGLSVEVHETAPAPVLDPWEEVVEVSIRSQSGALAFATTESGLLDDDNLLDGDPVLGVEMAPWTWCRVRVHARGRDAGNEHVATVPEPPVEEHLVQIWPAEPTPTVAYKLTDALGQRARSRAT